jgi:hypothetical protein
MAEHGCDLLLCDEAHRSAAEKAEAAILSVPWRLGMSGTLYLTDESRRLKAFEQVLYRYTAADARADGVIVPVEIIDAGDEDAPDGLDRDRSLGAMLGMLRDRPDLGPGLVAAASLGDAAYIAAAMCDAGIRARAVSGEDGRGERRAAVRDIVSGALDLAGPVGTILKKQLTKELGKEAVKYTTKREAAKAAVKEAPREIVEEFLTG